MKVWATRDRTPSGVNKYHVYFGRKPSKKKFVLFDWQDSDIAFDPEDFEKHHFAFKPGVGPIKCKLKIERD